MSSGSVLVCTVTCTRRPHMPGWTPQNPKWWPRFIRWATPWRLHAWYFTQPQFHDSGVGVTFTESTLPSMKVTVVGPPRVAA